MRARRSRNDDLRAQNRRDGSRRNRELEVARKNNTNVDMMRFRAALYYAKDDTVDPADTEDLKAMPGVSEQDFRAVGLRPLKDGTSSFIWQGIDLRGINVVAEDDETWTRILGRAPALDLRGMLPPGTRIPGYDVPPSLLRQKGYDTGPILNLASYGFLVLHITRMPDATERRRKPENEMRVQGRRVDLLPTPLGMAVDVVGHHQSGCAFHSIVHAYGSRYRRNGRKKNVPKKDESKTEKPKKPNLQLDDGSALVLDGPLVYDGPLCVDLILCFLYGEPATKFYRSGGTNKTRRVLYYDREKHLPPTFDMSMSLEDLIGLFGKPPRRETRIVAGFEFGIKICDRYGEIMRDVRGKRFHTFVWDSGHLFLCTEANMVLTRTAPKPDRRLMVSDRVKPVRPDPTPRLTVLLQDLASIEPYVELAKNKSLKETTSLVVNVPSLLPLFMRTDVEFRLDEIKGSTPTGASLICTRSVEGERKTTYLNLKANTNFKMLGTTEDDRFVPATPEVFAMFRRLHSQLRCALMHPYNFSSYSPDLLDMLRRNPGGSKWRLIHPDDPAEPCPEVGIDFSDAYARIMSTVTHIPLFHDCDVAERYLNTPIEPLALYLLRCTSSDPVVQRVEYGDLHVCCFGEDISRHTAGSYQILFVIRPLEVMKVDFKSAIQNILFAKMEDGAFAPMHVVKLALVAALGEMGKVRNKREEVMLCRDDDKFQRDYDRVFERLDLPLPAQVGTSFNYLDPATKQSTFITQPCILNSVNDVVFSTLKVSVQRACTNGTRPLQVLLFRKFHLMMMERCRALQALNVEPRAVLVDNVVIAEADLPSVLQKRPHWFIDTTLPDYKRHPDNVAKFPLGGHLVPCKLERKPFKGRSISEIYIEDEIKYKTWREQAPLPWVSRHEPRHGSGPEDWQRFAQEIESLVKGRPMPRACWFDIARELGGIRFEAKFPGSAKTGSMFLFAEALCGKDLDGVVYVSPNNQRCREEKSRSNHENYQCATFHKLLNLKIDGTRSRKKHVDLSIAKCVIFDEVFMSNIGIFKQACKFAKSHPEIVFLAAGDAKQLGGICNKETTTVANMQKVYDWAFPSTVLLRFPKRYSLEDARKMLDVANAKTDMDALIAYQKHVPELRRDERYTYGFAYRQLTAHRSNQQVIDAMGGFEAALAHACSQVICKIACTVGSIEFYLGSTYNVCEMRVDEVEVEGEEGTSVCVPIADFHECFELPFFGTVHSRQGATMTQPYVVILDAPTRVTKEWLNVAISRSSRGLQGQRWVMAEQWLRNPGELRKRALHVSSWKKRIRSHRKNDQAKGRDVSTEDAVTYDWVLDQYTRDSRCRECRCHMHPTSGPSQVTMDRRNEAIGLSKTNTFLSCKTCNTSASNRRV